MEADIASDSSVPIECPVCPRGRLPPHETTCPTCRTDLGALARLSALTALVNGSGPAGGAAPRPRRGPWLLAGAAGLAAGILMGTRIARPAAASPPPPVVASTEARPEPDPPAPSLDGLAAALGTVDGVTVERTANALFVSPGDALFARGSAVPSPRAVALARAIAEALGSSTHALHVRVEGHTDDTAVRPDGRWPDNWSLGLARAHAVADGMRGVWGESRLLQNVTLEIASAGARPSARPGAGAQRTVLLRVTVDPPADPPPATRGR